jgi:hypothetical protein
MSNVKVDTSLGRVVMYSLDTHYRVSMDDFEKLVTQFNVDRVIVPNPLTDQGAFQRSSTYAASTFVMAKSPCLCKEIENNDDRIVRTFEKRVEDSEDSLAKVVKGDATKPVYEHVGTMVFDKDTGTVLRYVIRPEGKSVIDKAFTLYNDWKWTYGIQQIRAFIQNAFHKYGSIMLRSNGGVNFIPNTYEKEFGAFVKVCEQLDGVDIVTLDIGETDKNKSTISKALQEHITGSLEEEIKMLDGKTVGSKALTGMIADFSEALKGGAIKKQALTHMVDRFDYTTKLVKQYQELLQTDLSVTESQMELAKEQVVKLLGKSEDIA